MTKKDAMTDLDALRQLGGKDLREITDEVLRIYRKDFPPVAQVFLLANRGKSVVDGRTHGYPESCSEWLFDRSGKLIAVGHVD